MKKRRPQKMPEAHIAQQVPLRLPNPWGKNAVAQMAFQSGLAIQAESRAARTSQRSTSACSPLAFIPCCGWALRGRSAPHCAPILAFQACSSKPLRNGTTLGEVGLGNRPCGLRFESIFWGRDRIRTRRTFQKTIAMDSLTSISAYVVCKQFVMRFWGAIIFVMSIIGNPNSEFSDESGLLIRVALFLIGPFLIWSSFRFKFVQFDRKLFALNDDAYQYLEIQYLTAFSSLLILKVRERWYFTLGRRHFLNRHSEIDEFIKHANFYRNR